MTTSDTDSSGIFTDDWIVSPNPDLPERIFPDCTVKISNGRERFFVTIRDVEDGTGYLVGVIDNHLVLPAPYGFGDKVRFHRSNVMQLNTPDYRATRAAQISAIMQVLVDRGGYTREQVFAMFTHRHVNHESGKPIGLHVGRMIKDMLDDNNTVDDVCIGLQSIGVL